MRYVFALACLLVFSGAAHAVTFVIMNNNPAPAPSGEHFVSSTPRANQTLDQPPEAVIINFSTPVNPDKSSIRVFDLYGTELDDGTVTVNGGAMIVNLPQLPSGKYAVKWKTRCLCEDNTELSDEFHFTVR